MHEPILEAVGEGATVTGWRYLWLKYVSGFDNAQHCARCLIGPYSKRVRRDMPHNVPVLLDEATGCDVLYLCGVAERGGLPANFHLAVQPAPGEVAEGRSSQGTHFRIRNARRLEIPALPSRFDGRPAAFTTCRNWQFGVARYGLPRATLQASDPTSRPSGRPARGVRILL